MMVPKKSLILAGAALALFGASVSAQTVSNKLYKRAGGSVKQAVLDLGTGTYTRGPIAKNRGGTTIADFQNIDAFDGSGFGWLSIETGGGVCRWFANAAKGTGVNQSTNASDLMTDVVFFYCSNALDVNSGGAGGSVTLGFYEGYTIFGGAPTTTAAVVVLTGLPAQTASGSWLSPNPACFGLQVSFPTMVPFADSTFMGYSWQFDDTGTDGILGQTTPFLACVVSCSGFSLFGPSPTFGGAGTATGLGEDGQGMIGAWDQFCTAPLVSHTFAYGTVTPAFAPNTYSAFNMQVQEAGDLATTNANYNATVTPNADTLSATKAILGTTWTCTVTRAAVSGAGTYVVTVKKNKSLPNGTAATPPVTGRVLIGGTQLTSITGAHNGTTGTITSAIPLSFSFCGLHFAAQGRLTGGGIKLSSANEGTIGTF